MQQNSNERYHQETNSMLLFCTRQPYAECIYTVKCRSNQAVRFLEYTLSKYKQYNRQIKWSECQFKAIYLQQNLQLHHKRAFNLFVSRKNICLCL